MRSFLILVLGSALALFTPSSLAAQACQGSTAPRGSGIIVGGASFTDGANSFGPTIGGNFKGPSFGSASYAYTDVDGTDKAVHNLGALVGAEYLSDADVSLCLDGTFTHSWVSDLDIDGQNYGANASVGYAAGEGEVKIVPHGSVGVLHSTANVGVFEGSDTAALLRGGVTVGSRTFFVGGTVSYPTFENADPVFGVGVGLVF